MIGVRASQEAARVGDLSIRAQVRYTSNRRRRIPRRIIERYKRDESAVIQELEKAGPYIELIIVTP